MRTPIDVALEAKGVEKKHGTFAATSRLTAALDIVPANTRVHMVIEVPDNRGNKSLHLAWISDRSLSNETARKEIGQRLVRLFFDTTMPTGGV